MAIFSPNLENIQRLKVRPTNGELYFLKYLERALDDSFEIYFNPFLDGDRPDIIVLKEGVGAFVIEIKDWDLVHYSIDAKNVWHVDDGKGNSAIVKSPMAQAFGYKKNLYDLHLPVLGLAEIGNPNFFNVVHCFVYVHCSSDQSLKSRYDSALKEATQELNSQNINYQQSAKSQVEFERYEKSRLYWEGKKRALSRDQRITFTIESIDRLVEKISKERPHNLFDSRIYHDFARRLQATEHTKKQGRLPRLDSNQKKLADSLNSYSKIKGVAGCGKTTILALRVINALKRHDGQILVLTFNITLRNLILDKISDFQGFRNNPRIEVTNYHQFYNSQANNAGIDMGDHIEKYSFDRAYDIDIFGDIDGLPKYQTIVLDEVQDYCSDWVKIVRDNFLAENPEMVLFGDYSQNIYGREIGRASVVARGFGKWNKLTRNYRASASSPLNQFFKDFQQEFLLSKYQDAEIIEVPDQQLGLDLEQGQIQYFKIHEGYPAKAFEIIDSFVRKYNVNPNDVVVLGTRISDLRSLSELYSSHEKVSCMYETFEDIGAGLKFVKAFENFGLCNKCKANNFSGMENTAILKSLCPKCLEDFLKDEDLNVEKIRRRKKTHFYMNGGLIKFSTTHSFKGLEAKVAFYILGHDDLPELVYTSITRSVEHLVVIDFCANNSFEAFFREKTTGVFLS